MPKGLVDGVALVEEAAKAGTAGQKIGIIGKSIVEGVDNVLVEPIGAAIGKAVTAAKAVPAAFGVGGSVSNAIGSVASVAASSPTAALGVAAGATAAGVPGAAVGTAIGATATAIGTVAGAGLLTAGAITATGLAVGGLGAMAIKTNPAAAAAMTKVGVGAAKAAVNVGKKAFEVQKNAGKRAFDSLNSTGDRIKAGIESSSQRAQTAMQNAQERTTQRMTEADARRAESFQARNEQRTARAQARNEQKQAKFDAKQAEKQANAESRSQIAAQKHQAQMQRRADLHQQSIDRANEKNQNAIQNMQTRENAKREQAATNAERAMASTESRNASRDAVANMKHRQSMEKANLKLDKQMAFDRKISEAKINFKEQTGKILNSFDQKKLQTEATKQAKMDKSRAQTEASEQKFYDNMKVRNAKLDNKITRSVSDSAKKESQKQIKIGQESGDIRRKTLFDANVAQDNMYDINLESQHYAEDMQAVVDRNLAVHQQEQLTKNAGNDQTIMQKMQEGEQRRAKQHHEHNLGIQNIQNDRDINVHALATEENEIRTNMQEDARNHESALQTLDEKFKSRYNVQAEQANATIQTQTAQSESNITKYKVDTDKNINAREAELKQTLAADQEDIKDIKAVTKDNITSIKKDLQRYSKEASTWVKQLKAESKFNINEMKGQRDNQRTTTHNAFLFAEEKKNSAHIQKLETMLSETEQLNHATKINTERYKQEKAAINDEYEKAINTEKAMSDSERMEIQARHESAIDALTVDHNNKMNEIYQRMEALANEYNQTLNSLKQKMSPELQERLKDPAFRAKVTKLLKTGAIKDQGRLNIINEILQAGEAAQNGQEFQRPEVVVSDATKARRAKKEAQAAEAQKQAQIVELPLQAEQVVEGPERELA